MVEEWLPAALGLEKAFSPNSSRNVPQSESFFSQSFMPLPATITMKKRTEYSDGSKLHAQPYRWGESQAQPN